MNTLGNNLIRPAIAPAIRQSLRETFFPVFRFTVLTTGSIDPVWTAASLSDADFTWIRPNGTIFTGKAPASDNFDSTGEYACLCTSWAGVTRLDFGLDAIKSNAPSWNWLFKYLTGSFSCNGTSVSGDVSGWDLSKLTGSFYCNGTSVSGDVSGWDLSKLTGSFYCNATSVSGDVSGWNLSKLTGTFSCNGTNVSGDVSGWDLSKLTGTFSCNGTNVSGDVSGWDLSKLTESFSCNATSVDYDATSGAFSTIKYSISINASNCAMTSTQVDNMLVDCNAASVANWGGKLINVSGTNAAPSATGLAAKASLEAKNAIVTVSV